MPKKFYCEYCDVYLKNSSRVTRNEHNKGRRHVSNKVQYYKKIIDEQRALNMQKKLIEINNYFKNIAAGNINNSYAGPNFNNCIPNFGMNSANILNNNQTNYDSQITNNTNINFQNTNESLINKN